MQEPLLATKLYIPPVRKKLVHRTRLLQRLNEGIAQNCRLLLVSAPAGCGKSTLVSEWVAQSGLPAAWLSLESEENTPALFWSYFVAALRTIPQLRQAGVGEALLDGMRATQAPEMEPLLADLVNEFARLDERVVLVLDDLHTITQARIQRELVFLVDHLPLHAQAPLLVVSSRMDPPWPLARWRMRSEMVELRTRDLRFSAEESAAFLNDVMMLKLSADELAALEQRTEGWIAGLQLAALSMQGREDTAKFLEGFSSSHHFVLDYLVEEVLEQQAPEIQNFLMQTSILEHLTAGLCDRVTERDDSQEMLEHLENANMFLVSLDNERRWYRYHHLFAAMLRVRLKKKDRAVIPSLHERACAWYSDQGYLSKALMHAIITGDRCRPVELVKRYAFTILDVNDATTFLTWLNSLPERDSASQPWLQIARAWLLTYLGQSEGVEQAILEAEKYAGSADERLLGYIAAMRTLLAEMRNLPEEGLLNAGRAFELLPPDEFSARAFVSYHLGNLLFWEGKTSSGFKALEDAISWSQAAGDLEMAMTAQFEKASVLRVFGRLDESMELFEKTFQMAEAGYLGKGYRSLPVGFALMQVSLLYIERNQLDDALRCVRDGLQICRRWGYSDFLYNALAGEAKILLASGDVDGAQRAIREARQLFPDVPPDCDQLGAVEAAIYLAAGDLASALAWAANSGLDASDTPAFAQRVLYENFAAILMSQGKNEEAYSLLERLGNVLEEAGALTMQLEIQAKQVLALQAMRKTEQALVLLQRALRLAQPEGFIWVFSSKGPTMAALLQLAMERGGDRDYIQKLLRASKPPAAETARETPAAETSQVDFQIPALYEALSARELEVLCFLNTHLTVEEIAREMYLAPSTIRTHIRNIYGKFGVHNRLEALQRASELRLV